MIKIVGFTLLGIVVACCILVIIGCATLLLGGYNNERMEDRE